MYLEYSDYCHDIIEADKFYTVKWKPDFVKNGYVEGKKVVIEKKTITIEASVDMPSPWALRAHYKTLNKLTAEAKLIIVPARKKDLPTDHTDGKNNKSGFSSKLIEDDTMGSVDVFKEDGFTSEKGKGEAINEYSDETRLNDLCSKTMRKYDFAMKYDNLEKAYASLEQLNTSNCPEYQVAYERFEPERKDRCQTYYSNIKVAINEGDREYGFRLVNDLYDLGCPQAERAYIKVDGIQPAKKDSYSDTDSDDIFDTSDYCKNMKIRIDTAIAVQDFKYAQLMVDSVPECEYYAGIIGKRQDGRDNIRDRECQDLKRQLEAAVRNRKLKQAQYLLRQSSKCSFYQEAHQKVSALAGNLVEDDFKKRNCLAYYKYLQNALRSENLTSAREFLSKSRNCPFYSEAKTEVQALVRKVNKKQECKRISSALQKALRSKQLNAAQALLQKAANCDYYHQALNRVNQLKTELTQVKVPNLIGMKYERAKDILYKLGLGIASGQTTVAPSLAKKFTIINQRPAAETIVKKGTKIILDAYGRKCSEFCNSEYRNSYDKTWGQSTGFSCITGDCIQVPCNSADATYRFWNECTKTHNCYKKR